MSEKIKYKEAVPFMQDTHIQGMVSGYEKIWNCGNYVFKLD